VTGLDFGGQRSNVKVTSWFKYVAGLGRRSQFLVQLTNYLHTFFHTRYFQNNEPKSRYFNSLARARYAARDRPSIRATPVATQSDSPPLIHRCTAGVVLLSRRTTQCILLAFRNRDVLESKNYAVNERRLIHKSKRSSACVIYMPTTSWGAAEKPTYRSKHIRRARREGRRSWNDCCTAQNEHDELLAPGLPRASPICVCSCCPELSTHTHTHTHTHTESTATNALIT